jgi:hypothetical protein
MAIKKEIMLIKVGATQNQNKFYHIMLLDSGELTYSPRLKQGDSSVKQG